DMAVLETDRDVIEAFRPAGERKLSDATPRPMLAAPHEGLQRPRGAPQPPIFAQAGRRGRGGEFPRRGGVPRATGLHGGGIGMHGQTVVHERPQEGRIGRTVQLGDARLLATLTGLPVAYDFRTADVAAGGEGAPLAPIYHLARARFAGIDAPLAVLNIGGVA